MNRYKNVLWFLVSATTPLFFVLSAIRLALTPLFITLEYQLPNFPPDAYGFSQAERLTWADFSIKYLLGRESHQTLAQTAIADGTRLFNDRELLHMLDVRNLTTAALNLWYIILLIILAGYLIALHQNETGKYWAALQRGAMFTIMAIFFILLTVWLNFNWLFTKFHEIFFEGNSWLFYPTDHLIRLFPLRFWQDLFIFIGVVIIATSLIIILTFRSSRHRGKN